ncbi:MAG: hypothetical protein AB7O26_08180 [Planctomycetaceae bacterium]
MQLWDRLVRSLFVALGVGLAWGIRGDFGHSLGAMFPGAVLGLGFAYVTGQRTAMAWMPLLGACGAFFISIGGMMSYGVLHGYAQADTFINYSYGFFTLVLQGGAWGGFGGAALGLLLEKERPKLGEILSCVMSAFAAGWLTYFVVVHLIGFHINPPRSDLSINFAGQMIGLLGWMIVNKKWVGLKGLSLGFIGFGLGMALGRLEGNAIRHLPFDINHWNVMEVSCGFWGGLVFTFGMLGRRLPDPPLSEGWPQVSNFSIFYVLGFIPLLHRLLRINPDAKLESWTNSFLRGGVTDRALAEAYALQVAPMLDAICVAAIVGALFWLFLWRSDRQRWAWFPVLALSLAMLLFQNVNVVYLWEPTSAQNIAAGGRPTVNMHTVFWWLFGGMVLFTIAFELFWPQREVIVDDATADEIPWQRWLSFSFATFAMILVIAAFTNNEETMKTANTRFPIWSWTDGPFPGSPEKRAENERRMRERFRRAAGERSN